MEKTKNIMVLYHTSLDAADALPNGFMYRVPDAGSTHLPNS